MSNRRAIGSTQSHAEATQRSSEALRGTQRHSEALRRNQTQSEALRHKQMQSGAIRRNQTQSEGTQQHSEGTQRAPGPEIASAIIGGAAARARARARLLRHRRAHLPVPFAPDDPRSAALVLRVPAPQGGDTPAEIAKSNDNAEVKAFFARMSLLMDGSTYERPDAEVLPLITPAAARATDSVRRISYTTLGTAPIGGEAIDGAGAGEGPQGEAAARPYDSAHSPSLARPPQAPCPSHPPHPPHRSSTSSPCCCVSRTGRGHAPSLGRS